MDGLYYTNSIDIFATGVVLFILMTGYPPFKSADSNDKWYQYIVKKDYQSFWRAHRNSGLKKAETDLITRMLLYDFNTRISLEKIKLHPWYKEQVLEQKQLEQVLTMRHQEMELKRSIDDTKQAILQHSEKVQRPILPVLKERIIKKGYKLDRKAPLLPGNIKPNMIRDMWTKARGYEVLQEIRIVIEDDMSGILINPEISQIFMSQDIIASEDNNNNNISKEKEKGEIDIDNFCLTATIAHLNLKQDNEEDDDDGMGAMEIEGITLNVQLYYDEKKKLTLVQFNVIPKNQGIDVEQDFNARKQSMKMWRALRDAFSRRAAHVLTGPSKEKMDANKKALYEKCFPPEKDQPKQKQIDKQ